jgi:flagellar biosynthesis/type III secretory pathway protein FliH
LDEARSLSKNLSDVRHTTLRVHPEVAETLRTSESEVLEEIEDYLGVVDLTGDKTIHQEQFDFAFV